MKKSIFAGAAIAALMSAGAASAHEGHIDLAYQSNDVGSDNVDSTSLSGAILVTPNFQFNARYANVDLNGLGSGGDYWSADAFLFNRTDAWAYGGFVGFDEIGGTNEWSVGGLVQAFTDNVNWTAQLGYADTEGEAHNINLDGEGRYFVTDDFALSANLGYGDINSDGNYWSAGLGAEFGMGMWPVSVYGGWQHYEFDNGSTNDLGIGIRWNFGGGTVKERSRTGASMQRNTRTLGDLELGGGFSPR